ncbi:MAG: hypothetical protein A2X12_08605 [Bacteroidetes bacterium GWE2_29_8]|nr:MAG: hypothetical protein A2X12_08605 [Bacteroidetes bacterium GWE2_29_8]
MIYLIKHLLIGKKKLMNRQQLYTYIQTPDLLSNNDFNDLSTLIKQYPYCQTLRLLYLKSLHNDNNILFENELKITAAYASNRTKLYYLINGENKYKETSQNNTKYNDNQSIIEEEVIESADIDGIPFSESNSDINNIEEIINIIEPENIQSIENDVNIEDTEEIIISTNDNTAVIENDINIEDTEEIIISANDNNPVIENDVKIEDTEEIFVSTNDNNPVIENDINIEDTEEIIINTNDNTAVIENDINIEDTEEIFVSTNDNNLVIENNIEIDDIINVIEPINENLIKKKNILVDINHDKYSFEDWMRILQEGSVKIDSTTTVNDLNKENIESLIEESFINNPQTIDEKTIDEKELIIEKFITNEPTIVLKKNSFFSSVDVAKQSVIDNEEIISETLAKIYLKQGNYEKAISIFKKLILKYPKKNTYFALEIEKIENEFK